MRDDSGIRELGRQLPVDRLDPARRVDLERALSGVDPGHLATAVRDSVNDLLLTGDLVRVGVEGNRRNGSVLALVEGTSRLIDLAALPPAPRGSARAAEAGGGEPRATDTVEPPGLNGNHDPAAFLEAMERAQDLAVGDPRAEDPWVMVGRILALLEGFVPDLALHAQLSVPDGEPASPGLLLPRLDVSEMPFWLRHRRPGQALWIPSDTELPSALQQRLEQRDSGRATAVVPIMSPNVEDGEIGLLYVSGATSWQAEPLLKLAQRLSSFVSRRWRCQRDVNRRVLTDSLTGIPNRAYFDSQFPLELERMRRRNAPLTLVIGDLDHFKAINDTHGHQCGDRVLRSVARDLLGALRRIDIVCRIGGEEFALILPSTSSEAAQEVLGRMAGRPFRVTLPPEFGVGVITATMSYGAVTFPESGGSPGELHRKADHLLYEAKERGRNRCCLTSPSGLVVLPGGPSVG